MNLRIFNGRIKANYTCIIYVYNICCLFVVLKTSYTVAGKQNNQNTIRTQKRKLTILSIRPEVCGNQKFVKKLSIP